MSEHAPFADRAVSNDMTRRGPQLHLLLQVRRRDRAGAGFVAAQPDRRTPLARRLHAASVAGIRAAGWPSARIRRPAVHACRPACRARRGVWRPRFADEFFDRYIEGREWPDFAALLSPAGYVLQSMAPDRGWIGDVPVAPVDGGLAVGHGRGGRTLVPFGTPLYDAGVDLDDVITADRWPARDAGGVERDLAAQTWRSRHAYGAPPRRPDRVHESDARRRPAHPRRPGRSRRRVARPPPSAHSATPGCTSVDVRALAIAVASAFFLGATPVFAAEPVVAVWYRGTPAGTPRLDDLAAIKVAGFNAIAWPPDDPQTVADRQSNGRDLWDWRS